MIKTLLISSILSIACILIACDSSAQYCSKKEVAVFYEPSGGGARLTSSSGAINDIFGRNNLEISGYIGIDRTLCENSSYPYYLPSTEQSIQTFSMESINSIKYINPNYSGRKVSGRTVAGIVITGAGVLFGIASLYLSNSGGARFDYEMNGAASVTSFLVGIPLLLSGRSRDRNGARYGFQKLDIVIPKRNQIGLAYNI